MKNLRFILSVFIFFGVQEYQAQSIETVVSRDSILQDNYYTISFVIENCDGEIKDVMLEDFNVVSSSSQSSSTFINGEGSTRKVVKYTIFADDIGSYMIPPISATCQGELLETFPIEVIVYPNPEGIIQEDNSQEINLFEYNMPTYKNKQKKVKKESKPSSGRVIKKI